MNIKISPGVSPKTEVDGEMYAIAPLWYAVGFSTEGVMAAIHDLGGNQISYIPLSDIFGNEAELRHACATGFAIVGTNKAKRITHALLETKQAEVVHPNAMPVQDF